MRFPDFRSADAGQLLTDDMPFCRIVINKNQALRQQVEGIGYFAEVPVLRLPVRPDLDKIFGCQSAVRMLQPRQGILFIVLGVNIQHDAQLFLGFQVLLELGEHLPGRCLRPDADLLRAVIPDDAAPQRIVQVQDEALFVLSEKGFDDPGHIEGQIRHGADIQRIFVHMPVKRIAPFLQSVICGNVVDVADVEVPVRPRVGIKGFVQAGKEVGPPVEVRRVPVPEQAVQRQFEVVLDHRASVSFRKVFPDSRKLPHFGVQQRLDLLFLVGKGRICRHIPVGGMDIDQVRPERLQLFVAEAGVLVVFSVFRLIEVGFDSLVQEKKVQNLDNGGSG